MVAAPAPLDDGVPPATGHHLEVVPVEVLLHEVVPRHREGVQVGHEGPWGRGDHLIPVPEGEASDLGESATRLQCVHCLDECLLALPHGDRVYHGVFLQARLGEGGEVLPTGDGEGIGRHLLRYLEGPDHEVGVACRQAAHRYDVWGLILDPLRHPIPVQPLSLGVDDRDLVSWSLSLEVGGELEERRRRREVLSHHEPELLRRLDEHYPQHSSLGCCVKIIPRGGDFNKTFPALKIPYTETPSGVGWALFSRQSVDQYQEAEGDDEQRPYAAPGRPPVDAPEEAGHPPQDDQYPEEDRPDGHAAPGSEADIVLEAPAISPVGGLPQRRPAFLAGQGVVLVLCSALRAVDHSNQFQLASALIQTLLKSVGVCAANGFDPQWQGVKR